MVSIKPLLALLLMLVLTSATSPEQTKNLTAKVVQVSASSLEVLVQAFDQVVIYFYNSSENQKFDYFLEDFQKMVDKIHQKYQQDHTIFGHIDINQVNTKNLQKYGLLQGFKLINAFKTYSLDKFLQVNQLPYFYEQKVHPLLPLDYRRRLLRQENIQESYEKQMNQLSLSSFSKSLHQIQLLKDSYYQLLFQFSSQADLDYFNQVYQKNIYYLEQFNIAASACPRFNTSQSKVTLFNKEKQIAQYSFYNRTVKQFAHQLVQFLNIDTLPSLTYLNQVTFHRIFGGNVQDQILFLNKNGVKQNDIQVVLQQFESAADSNKQDQMAFQRVMFARVDDEVFSQYFNQDVSQLVQGNSSFTILFTKTDFDKFQVKKYVMNQDYYPINKQNILKFIQDVKMRKLDPVYKSQKVPLQHQNKGILRKIVGKSFISQVYEKRDQSVMVLFVDSKDQVSYLESKKIVQQFAQKYKKRLSGQMTTAIFDLALNQHQLLYLREAPQLVLFDHANKKQPKHYPLPNQGFSVEKIVNWLENAATNIQLKEPLMVDL